jgi:hypothetical protein
MDGTAFEKDQKTYDAVERCLERISEAAAKLGDLAASLVPGHLDDCSDRDAALRPPRSSGGPEIAVGARKPMVRPTL